MEAIEFLDAIYKDIEGYVNIVTMDPLDEEETVKSKFVEWPAKRDFARRPPPARGGGAGDRAVGEVLACRDEGGLGDGDIGLSALQGVGDLFVVALADDVLG